MSNIETFDDLPENYDLRLTNLLDEAIPHDVIVSFYYVAVSKNPSNNYRWELHRDGRLYITRHSGKNPSFEITFDKPLPKKPTKILSKDKISALYKRFEETKFFEQPKFRKVFVQGGSYVILRVRRNNSLYEVVYENVESPLIDYLYSITEK